MGGQARRARDADAETPLDRGIRLIRPGVMHLCALSLVINLLSFSTVIYSMEVFNRVMSTRSVNTLVGLTLIFMLGTILSAALVAMRASALRKMGIALNEEVSAPLYDLVYSETLETRRYDTMGAFRDLETVRTFLSGQGLAQILDLPWIPIYVLVGFVMHVWLGLALLASVVVVLLLAALNEVFNRSNLKHASVFAEQSQKLLATATREAETLHVMAMVSGFRERWLAAHHHATAWQLAAAHLSKGISLLLKFWQSFTSFGLVALGCYLAIGGHVSPGAMFAVMFIGGACVGVVQSAANQWPSFLRSRQAYGRLQALFRAAEAAPQRLALPRPNGRVEVSGLALTAPGSNHFILSQVSFELPAGSSTAVVGPSGAGKSSLVRALVGIWAPALGSVRIDGSELQHWDADALGQHLGYLPQNVELLSGTIAQNIARFGAVDDEAVLGAAKLAGVHEVIQQLPQGYNTEVGEGGSALSGGQRQRIGLARAIYGNPSLVVLDEPNSNLDAVGEAALAEALQALTKRGTTCVLITHKANILTLVDYILVLKDGTVSTFGARDEVLSGQGAGRSSATAAPQQLTTRHAAVG